MYFWLGTLWTGPASRDLAGRMKEEIIYYEGTETGKIAQRICEYSIPEKIQDQVGPEFENLT